RLIISHPYALEKHKGVHHLESPLLWGFQLFLTKIFDELCPYLLVHRPAAIIIHFNVHNFIMGSLPSRAPRLTPRINDDDDYQVVEKDYGDRKVIYHIPVEYADQYDLDNVDETMFDRPVKPRIARVMYRPYKTIDTNDYYYEYEQPDYESVQMIYVYQRPIRQPVYILEEGDPSITALPPSAISQSQRPIIDQQSQYKPIVIRRY
ncbi:unnamed protein product, partial [Didymodactylos carnosus]